MHKNKPDMQWFKNDKSYFGSVATQFFITGYIDPKLFLSQPGFSLECLWSNLELGDVLVTLDVFDFLQYGCSYKPKGNKVPNPKMIEGAFRNSRTLWLLIVKFIETCIYILSR